MPILLECKDRSNAAHRHGLPVEINRAIENLNRRDKLPTIARNQAQLIPKPRIKPIVPLEKRAVAIPPREQIENFVTFIVMRRSDFHNFGFVT